MIVCSGILHRKTWEIILIISLGIAECQVTHMQVVELLFFFFKKEEDNVKF